MPYEKQNNNTQSRPLMPTLSTGNKAQRAPITPRIAAVGSPSLSPLLRRGTAPVDFSVTPKASTKDEISTPVKSFLGSNVIPRSSSRKAKIDTTLTPTGTPNGTPDGSRPTTGDEEQPRQDDQEGGGFGMPLARDRSPERPSSLISEGYGHHHSSSFNGSPSFSHQNDRNQGGQDSPRFFYASDAKASQSKPTPSRPPPPNKQSTFLYANGERDESSLATHSSSSSAVGDSRSQSRFFHANGLPDTHMTSPPIARPKSQSNSSSVNSPRLATFSPPGSNRPPSPLKQGPQRPTLKSPPVASPPTQRPISSPFANTPTTTIRSYPHAPNAQRDASPQPSTARRASHGRSASVGSMDSSPITVPVKRSMRTESISTSVSSAFISNPRSPINEELETFTGSDLKSPIFSPKNPQSPPLIPSAPQSPTKTVSAGGSLAHLNELAEKARRERKVQDLEISNSSLLAINRALEREMRKQSTELRRFRRLSRSGRLSLAGSGMGIGGHLAPLSEGDGVEGFLSSDEEQMNASLTSSSPSEDEAEDEAEDGESQAASDLRHRAKDEMRLQLDLSKHRQLLVDSQKMNQSLKRCLGRTEMLIEEGRKALDFQVRVSDVNLGGRVLVGDEDGEDEGVRDSDSHGPDHMEETDGVGKDRDSGVDCDLSRSIGEEELAPT